jgi:UDP-N-acetyl-D-galactosamine dehydrogenase
LGYHPDIILARRRINDGMGAYVASQLIKAMVQKDIPVAGAKVLIMGLAFKENCPDLRNTRVVDILKELRGYRIQTEVYDPWASTEDAQREYGITPVQVLEDAQYDAIILAVAHQQFRDIGVAKIQALGKPAHVIYDLKYLFAAHETTLRL